MPHTLDVADVLEVIAEYACATVKGACALRAANKGYRRAVDTSVRRLVYEDQPLVRTSREVTLRMHCGTEHLDAVRIAFTCDAFKKIARLVVVAFALDGAKDELREAAECGPRPVSCSGVPANGFDISSSRLASEWIAPLSLAPASSPGRPCAMVVERLMIDAAVSWRPPSAGRGGEAGPPEMKEEVEPAAAQFPRLKALEVLASPTCGATDPQPFVLRLLARQTVGPQLTHLFLPGLTSVVCRAIEGCTGLTHVRVGYLEPARCNALSESLVDALISSRAPLEAVCVNDMVAADAQRLAAAVPSIVWLRTRWFSPALQRAAHVQIAPRGWEPSASATHLTGPTQRPLRIADLATAYPRLASIEIHDVACTVGIRGIQFPPALNELLLRPTTNVVAVASEFASHIGGIGPSGLPNLTSVELPGSTPDISPLVAFARTLRRITLSHDGEMSADVRAVVEATLSQLVGLRSAKIEQLPSARCFLAGRHTQLRGLYVAEVNTPDAPLAQLVKACPRLMFVSAAWDGPLEPRAPGWDKQFLRFVSRTSL
jgi:hypothetical protein